MPKNQHDIIILSPHLDDSIASIGGFMSKKIDEGKMVHSVTYFTEGIDHPQLPEKYKKYAIYTKRKEEDKQALDFLGATYQWVDLPERVMREPWLKNVLEVFRTPKSITDFQQLKNIQDNISSLLKQNPNAEFYIPLGIGNHQDHVEVFLAAFLLMLEKNLFKQFFFYEELYSLGTRMRRRHFLTKTKMWNKFQAPALSSPRLGMLLFVMGINNRGSKIEDYIQSQLSSIKWKVQIEILEAKHITKKVNAMFLYPSQTHAFGGKRKRAESILRKYYDFWKGGVPIWTAEIIEKKDNE